MTKKKEETVEDRFYETASRCITHLAEVKCWDGTSAAMTSSIATLSLSVMAVAEQLRIANLIALSEALGTAAGDAAWAEINGTTDTSDGGDIAPWVARALGLDTEEEAADE